MVSMGGLEPPRISPHAPQTCTSTIPPLRHILFNFQTYFFVMWRSIRSLGFCFTKNFNSLTLTLSLISFLLLRDLSFQLIALHKIRFAPALSLKDYQSFSSAECHYDIFCSWGNLRFPRRHRNVSALSANAHRIAVTSFAHLSPHLRSLSQAWLSSLDSGVPAIAFLLLSNSPFGQEFETSQS